MKWPAALLAASLGLAFAHDDHGQHVPKLLGGRKFMSTLEARRKVAAHEQHAANREHVPASRGESLVRRQDDDDDDDDEGRCGPGIGSCSAGDCCSFEGCVSLAALLLTIG
jgi:hypothetical protein